MDKENVVHKYNVFIQPLKKEGNFAICNDMDEL